MSEKTTKQLIERISKTRHKYCGSLDQNGFRMGSGCEEWCKETIFQKYSGQFLYNNLHSKGIYLTDKKGDQTYFDGLFYANKLEGYGKVIYSDGSIFEGLFKQHNRFGPGVVTYSNNSQDVGIWEGFSLIRLSVIIGGDFVPRLGRTSAGKARLLKFRTLVPICPAVADKAKKILNESEANEEIKAQSDQLYNYHIRNPESVFFNKSLYDENFFTKQDCTIDVKLTSEEFEEEQREQFEEQTEQPEENQIEESDSNFTLPKNNSQCSCFQTNLDRFTRLCVQLNDVELKLEKLTTKRQRLKEKLQICRHCCDIMMKKESAQSTDGKPEDKEELLANTILTSDESLDKVAEFKKEVQKKRSLFSSSESEQNNPFTKSEIELQTYLYSITGINDEENEVKNDIEEDTVSKITLPFTTNMSSLFRNVDNTNRNQISSSKIFSVRNFVEFAEETENVDYPVETGSQTCYCNQLVVENYEVLKSKFEALNKEELFYNAVKRSLKDQLDVEFQKVNVAEEEETKFIKKIAVTHLMAWNNETIWTTMLQHCFRHRTSENNVSFSVSDLLSAHRNYFKTPGIYEINCRKFLGACSDGHHRNAFRYLKTYNINPDICDAKGNTGMMLAAIRDKSNVIGMLVNCGGKIDVMNDEGLTPLAMSLLKYIAFKHHVFDWEKAFLRDSKLEFEDLIQQWRPSDSLVSLGGNNYVIPEPEVIAKSSSVGGFGFSLNDIFREKRIPTEQKMSEVNVKLAALDVDLNTLSIPALSAHKEQKYIFNTDFVKVPRPHREQQSEKNKGKKRRKKKQTKEAKKRKKHKIKTSKEEADTEDEKVYKKVEIIKKTIVTLLSHGSDPNIGDAPLKSLFLSIFTDDSDLMRMLLENNADPNFTTTDENLTCLHVIASLQPTIERVKMCKILLDFGADPNIKTNENHWRELKNEIIGDGFNEIDAIDEGKNALHLLSLREDFNGDSSSYFGEIASILVSKGCKTYDLYLGHSPLSLAVLRGNIQLIESLLKTDRVNPHQLLGNGMGNALTVVILKRFSSVLTDDNDKKKIINCLFNNGLNPLNQVGDFENSIAFIENEEALLIPKKIISKITKKKSKKAAKKLPKKSKKSKKKSNKKKVETVESYIKAETKKILYRYLQSKAVEYLYTLITETLFADPLILILAKFVTPEETLNCVKLLFKYGIITPERFSHVVISDLLEFVKLQHDFDKIPNFNEKEELEEKIKNMSWSELNPDPKKTLLPLPETDRDSEKYKVCFQCLKKSGKKLLKCPSCELIYFCSEECNILSNATCDYHNCKILFYDAISQIIGEEPQPSRLAVLLEMAAKVREERIAMFKLRDLREKLANMKLKTRTTKQEAQQLLLNFRKLKKEKENFGRANNIWNFKQIYAQMMKTERERSRDKAKKTSTSNSEQAASAVYDAYSAVVYTTASDVAELTDFGDVISPNIISYDPVLETDLESPLDVTPASHFSSGTQIDTIPDSVSTAKFAPKPRNLVNFVNMKSESERVLKKHKQKHVRKEVNEQNKMVRSPIDYDDQIDSIPELNLAFDKAKNLPSKFVPSDDENLRSKRNQEVPKKVANQQYYMELLSKVFADFNLPLLLLPYACYKDGQVYYSMSGNMYFGKSFQKLKIPN
ncbi:Ank 2 domain containing protein [Asbolus verrucosus]|uniref:Ank 2 domain containing protein n=1 Tax=Asbolus verrucosus TaxID=1661398 RepID=A0A482VCU2_ASBVE|nr:Ank 2 domain containing protein [Asbolus verrucosus]